MPSRRYLCLHRRGPGTGQQPTPAQMQDMQSVFKAWMERHKANILDMGGPLKPGGKILTSSGVTDGPFAETKEIIGGYMLVSSESFEGALQIARESPALMMPGASVEVREVAGP